MCCPSMALCWVQHTLWVDSFEALYAMTQCLSISLDTSGVVVRSLVVRSVVARSVVVVVLRRRRPSCVVLRVSSLVSRPSQLAPRSSSLAVRRSCVAREVLR